MTKKIFISYDYNSDKHYKNLFKAWDTNGTFDFNLCNTITKKLEPEHSFY